MRERPTRPTQTFATGASLSVMPVVAFSVMPVVAFGVMLSIIVLSSPARAQDDDVPIDTKIMRGIMSGLGLRRDGDQKGINYGDRAPLVIPPSSALPPPENSGAVVARDPAWPKDPDVIRAKRQAAEENKNALNADQQLMSDQSALRPDQMTPGPKPREARRGDDGYVAPATGFQNPTPPTPKESFGLFGHMFAKDEPDYANFTGEPPRTELTEPPHGYQTPSPDQPFGVGKVKPKATTTEDYMRDHAAGEQ
jgi:hypothetical protein